MVGVSGMGDGQTERHQRERPPPRICQTLHPPQSVLEDRYASLQLTLIVPANRQHYERQKTVPRVAQAVPGACALLQERKPTVEVQFADRQEAESEERACAHAGGDGVWRRGRRGKRALEATARLGDQSHPETVVPE